MSKFKPYKEYVYKRGTGTHIGAKENWYKDGISSLWYDMLPYGNEGSTHLDT